MIRALAVVTVLAATAHTAAAGVYGSLGLGNTGVDDSANHFEPSSRSLRLAGGYQFTKYLGAEAGFIGYNAAFGADYAGREYYAAGLFHWPLGDGFEAFGRLGLEHTGLTTDSNQSELSGGGFLVGAGFEYKLKIPSLPVPNAGIWVDYTRNQSTLSTPDRAGTDRSFGTSMWTIGVTVGL